MLNRFIFTAAGILAATTPLSPAWAQSPVSSGLAVRLLVNASCDVTGSSTGGIGGAVLDFGTTSLLLDAINQSIATTGPQALEVLCNSGVAWTATFDAGLNGGGNIQNRAMRHSTGTEVVFYQLYSDTARSAILDEVSNTGTGSPQAINVYGQVPEQPAPPAGSYSDMVTVTVSF